MSAVDIPREIARAWAAGLFEGEGSVSLVNGEMRAQLKMTSEQSVRRFAEVVACGRVYGPYGPYAAQPTRSPHWLWVGVKDDLRVLAAIVHPVASEWMQEKLHPFAEQLRGAA